MVTNNRFQNSLFRIIEFALGVCIAAIVLCFLTYIVWAFCKPKIESLTRPLMKNEVTIKITKSEKKLLDALIDKGAVSPPQEVLSQIISFYDTQNAFLLGIMALSGIFGFLFIRQRTRNETEAMLKTEFNAFINTIDFQNRMNAIVNNSAIVQELAKTADELYGKIGQLNQLEERSDDKISPSREKDADETNLSENLEEE